MDQQKDRVNQLEADIMVIKEAIRSNNGFVRQFMASPNLGSFFLALGIASLLVPLMWMYVLSQFGLFQHLPAWFAILMVVATVAIGVGLSIWKLRSFTRAASGIDKHYRYTDVAKELASHPVFLHQFLVVALTVGFSIIVGIKEAAYLLPAVIAAGMAMVFMLYTVSFLLTEYMFITVWLAIFSIVSLLLPNVSPLLLSAIGFGSGFCIYGIYNLAVFGSQSDAMNTRSDKVVK